MNARPVPPQAAAALRVVPQQAAFAIRMLLTRLAHTTIKGDTND